MKSGDKIHHKMNSFKRERERERQRERKRRHNPLQRKEMNNVKGQLRQGELVNPHTARW